MKKIISLLLCVLTLSLTAASCGKSPVNEATTSAAPVQTTEDSGVTKLTAEQDSLYFMLEALPKLPKFVPKDKKFERFNEEYTSDFQPGKKYGKLIPFLGRYKDFYYDGVKDPDPFNETNYYDSIAFSRYGLMTVDGKIVVDAVYDSYEVKTLDDGRVIFSMDKDIPSGDDSLSYSTVIPQDGSWSITSRGYSQFYGNDFIVITDFEDSIYDNTCMTKVYNTNGKLLFTLPQDHRISSYSDGIFIVSHDYGESYNYKSDFYCIDTNGKKLFDLDNYVNEFSNGYAVAQKNGLYGLIDTNGNWFFKPIYQDVSYYNGKYVLLEGQLIWQVYDLKKNLIFSEAIKNDSDIFLYGEKDFIRCDGRYDTGYLYYNAITDELITCKETGMAATGYDYGSEFFNYTDASDVTHFFKLDGKILFSVKYGEYVNEDNGVLVVSRSKELEYGTMVQMGFTFLLASTYEEIFSFDCKGEGDYAGVQYSPNDSDYAVIYTQINGKTTSGIYDTKAKQFIFENCDSAQVLDCGGTTYFFVLKGNIITAYDKELNEIIRLQNEQTD